MRDSNGVVTRFIPHVNDIGIDAYGNIQMSSDGEAVKDIVDALVNTHRGEMQLAINRGIEYEKTVFANRMYLPIWESQVREAVLSCEGVVSIESFEYDIVDAELQYTIIIQTDYSGTETITNV